MAGTRFDPRKRPVQERSRRTVERILDAAARVFAAQGYASGTTDRIAAAAALSVGSLYQYFPNKDSILAALLERHVDEATSMLGRLEAAAAGQPLATVVGAFVAAMVELHMIEPRLHAVLFEESPRPAHLQNRLWAIRAGLAARLAARLRGDPSVTVPDPDLAALLVVDTVEGLTHGYVLHGEEMADEAAYVGEVTRLVLRYLTAPAASDPPCSSR